MKIIGEKIHKLTYKNDDSLRENPGVFLFPNLNSKLNIFFFIILLTTFNYYLYHIISLYFLFMCKYSVIINKVFEVDQIIRHKYIHKVIEFKNYTHGL